MTKKILLRLDKESILQAQMDLILANNTDLSHLHDDLYVFSFDSIVFTHAVLMLGTDESKYGFNLTNYLESTLNFFGHQKEDEYVNLSFGSTDFKKRAAEDLGVAIASLFMVKSFGLDWKTIIQLPRNSKLAKRTPDFSGFTLTGEQFIYECKGTTVSQKVESQIKNALDQVKNYPIAGARKFALASYFSSNKKTFYPMCFVFDPPNNPDFEVDKNSSVNIHYLDILNNVGLKQTYRQMRQAVSKSIAISKEKGFDIAYSIIESREMRNEFDEANREFADESKGLKELKYNGINYVGRELETNLKQGRFKLFFGIDRDVALKSLRFETSKTPLQTLREKNDSYQISVFSDGTLLRVENIIERGSG